jgi:hypothetical protein
MLRLSKFLETQTGRIIMSVILGFGLASIFKVSCKNKNCIVYRAPDINSINGNTYSFNDKCYNYNIKEVKCDKKKRIIH